MNFKQWLEMKDIMHRDTSAIQLQWFANEDIQGYVHEFTHGEQNFKVILNRHDSFPYPEVSGVYEISFKNDDGYSLTNNTGASANVIYTQVLLAIKKLFEIETINGLSFSAFQKEMVPLYRRFFNQYLKQDFIQIDHLNYIRKTKLQEVLKKRSPTAQEKIYKKILLIHRAFQKDIKDVQLAKQQARSFRPILNKLVGQFVYYNNMPVYLAKLDTQAWIIMADVLTKVDLHRLNVNQRPTPEEIKQLLQAVVQNPALRYEISYHDFGQRFLDLL